MLKFYIKYFKQNYRKDIFACGRDKRNRACEMLAICKKKWYNTNMENYLEALDEFFCAQYSDYVRISAIEGYVMPDAFRYRQKV